LCVRVFEHLHLFVLCDLKKMPTKNKDKDMEHLISSTTLACGGKKAPQ
jgi:hypothetical protein